MYDLKELDDAAWKGEQPPGLTEEETLYFLRMYYIYSEYRKGSVSKRAAEEMKTEFLYRRMLAKKEAEFKEGLYQCKAEYSQRAERAKSELLKGLCAKADAGQLLYTAISCIYGLTGDKAMWETYIKVCGEQE